MSKTLDMTSDELMDRCAGHDSACEDGTPNMLGSS